MKKLNAFQLKLLMSMLMVLDHLDKIPGLISADTSAFFHFITRCVSVCFAYMAVEGFLYTRNKIKYNLRLFFWAGIMGFGNYLINFIYASKEIYISNNIFLTLAVAVLVLNCLNDIKLSNGSTKFLRISATVLLALFAVVFTEGGVVVLPFVLISYLFREKVKVRNLLYVALSVLLFISTFRIYDSLEMTIRLMLFNSDWFFISVLPFLYLYNGERGSKNNFTKYFFYLFYPAHLWIIASVAFLIK